MIEIKNLETYIRKNPILRDISCRIGEGSIVALVGPNGAGKTTLLKHLNGLMKPSSGSVNINGLDTRITKTSILARQVGFLFQNPDQQILCSTVRDELCFGLKHCGIPKEEWEERVNRAASSCDLLDKLHEDPLLLPRSRRQRVALASVLAIDPSILVLDEPTSAQDRRETDRIMNMARTLADKGHTVIIVTHDMDLVARYADRVLVLIDGKLAADCSARELFEKSDLLHQGCLSEPGLYRIAKGLDLDLSMGKQYTVIALADRIAAGIKGEAV